MMKNCVNKSYYYYYYYYSYTLTSINCHFLNLIENYKLISFLIFPTLLVYRQRRSRARRRHGEVDLIRVEEVGSGGPEIKQCMFPIILSCLLNLSVS